MTYDTLECAHSDEDLMDPPRKSVLLWLLVLLTLCVLVWWQQWSDPPKELPGTTAAGSEERTAPLSPSAQDDIEEGRRVAVSATEASNSLAGRVVYAESLEPVASAQLIIRDGEQGEGLTSDSVEWQVLCDEDGRFYQSVGNRSVVQLEVFKQGCVPRKWPLVAVSGDLELQLYRGTELLVEVLYEEEKGAVAEPVSGAECRVVIRGDNDRKRILQRGTTNDRGEVLFNVASRRVHLVVEKEGLLSHVEIYELARDQDRLRVVLHPYGAVLGRVVDKHTDLPIPGATLTETNRPNIVEVSNLDGMFRLPHRLAENGLWRVQKEGYATVYVRVFPQTENEARIPDVELESTVTLTGSIVGFQGEVRVTAVSMKAWYVRQRWKESRFIVGDDDVRFDTVPPHEGVIIQALGREGQIGFSEIDGALPGQMVDFGVIQPLDPATVHGSVSGLQPDMPGLVTVQVRRSSVLVHDITRLVRGGEYQVDGLVAGEARVWVQQGEAVGTRTEIELYQGRHQRIDLDLGGTIKGEVLDDRGVGVAGAIIRIDDLSDLRSRRRGAMTDESGRFVLGGLDRRAVHRVSVSTNWPDRIIVPQVFEGVAPEASIVRFELVNSVLRISGRVNSSILENLDSGLLSVVCIDPLGKRVSGSVADDGTFSIPVRNSGPYVLTLSALDISRATLSLYPVPEVDVLRDVVPGMGGVVFRR